ncbi:MAG: mechanosensitive ion channel [Methanomassiliicoccales archaeon]|nr:MAG: mechanosensitive ion channel [Methanomassiliicoccales archaeon]
MRSRKTTLICVLVLAMLFLIPASASAFKTTPVDGRSDFPTNGKIIIEFDHTMDIGSVEVDIIPYPVYPVEKRWSNDDRTLTLIPTANLLEDERYILHISGDYENETLGSMDYTFSFRTEAPPSIMETLEDLAKGFWEGLKDLALGVAIFLILLIVGYFISKIGARVFSKALDRVGLNKVAGKTGFTDTLKTLGFESFTKLLGILFFWFLFLIILDIALANAGIEQLNTILAPIILFIPRILIAILVVVIGFYVADIVVNRTKNYLIEKSPFKEDLIKLDESTKKSGFSIFDFVFLFLKMFVILIFIHLALSILAISIFSDFITPILLVMPLVLIAMAIVVIGLIVAEYVVKFVMKLLDEFEFDKFIAPVEDVVEKEGIVRRIIAAILKVFVVLIFVQISIAVLNSTGAFNVLAELINVVILWLPNLLVALLIVIIGFWLASWIEKRILEYGEEVDLPFPKAISKAAQFLVIYLAVVMALAQVGVAVPILYIVFAIVAAAVFIGLGVGFAYGSKDIFHNLVGFIQTDKTMEVGQKVKVDKFEGTIEEIGRYHMVLKTKTGKIRIPHSMLTKAIIEETG